MTTFPRVLVIDDERDVGQFIATVSEAKGFRCMVTTDATSFLSELTPNTTLIFLDLMMPDLDGVELLRLLANRKCSVPIILMSGVGSRVLETAEQLALTLGLTIVGHLNKPFRLKELQAILAKGAVPSISAAAGLQPESDIHDDELRRAVELDEFELYYQPQLDSISKNVVGLEALVRWKHPERGLIFPDQFISRAEEVGLIDQLGWLVYGRGMRELGQFAGPNGDLPVLSLNVSLLSLKDLSFPDRFYSLIERNNIPANHVKIEITESGLMQEYSRTLDVLTRLRMKQICLSIDDFGTGYAAMHQLRNFPVTELKIDKSFVQNIESSERDRGLVQKTIELSHELGLIVVAEGVETIEQMEYLCANHCDVLQGYLFSRPLSVTDILTWLGNYRARQTN